jgi:hypothetical protein
LGDGPSHEDQRAYIQTVFTRQTVDAMWSRETTAHLRGWFDDIAGSGAAVRSVDCRASLCRAELFISTTQEAERVVHELLFQDPDRGWRGPMRGEPERIAPNGEISYVVFLAKEGTELPSLE